MIHKLKVLIFATLVAVCAASSINAGNKAAIVVDVQGCFTQLKNGSLAVGGTGEDYVASVREAVKKLKAAGIPVYATQDWHPAGHVSFASTHGKKPFVDTLELTINGKPHTQALWPDHCVQHTDAANILVDPSLFTAIIQKGTDPKYDSYSGFEDDNGKKTRLESLLREQGVSQVFVFGLATDYCVKATALDAKKAGFDVTVVTGLSRGVMPDTTEKALQEMKAKGIKIVDDIDYPLLNYDYEKDFERTFGTGENYQRQLEAHYINPETLTRYEFKSLGNNPSAKQLFQAAVEQYNLKSNESALAALWKIFSNTAKVEEAKRQDVYRLAKQLFDDILNTLK